MSCYLLLLFLFPEILFVVTVLSSPREECRLWQTGLNKRMQKIPRTKSRKIMTKDYERLMLFVDKGSQIESNCTLLNYLA